MTEDNRQLPVFITFCVVDRRTKTKTPERYVPLTIPYTTLAMVRCFAGTELVDLLNTTECMAEFKDYHKAILNRALLECQNNLDKLILDRDNKLFLYLSKPLNVSIPEVALEITAEFVAFMRGTINLDSGSTVEYDVVVPAEIFDAM